MDFINLTPYTYQIGNRIIVPSGTVCYVDLSDQPEMVVDEITISRRLHGAIIDLPDRKEHTMYIVSHTVRRMTRDRGDILSPGKILKFEDGIYHLESLRRI